MNVLIKLLCLHIQTATPSRTRVSEAAVSAPLPSSFWPPQTSTGQRNTFSGSRHTGKRSAGLIGHIRTWNKDIVCLPYSHETYFTIPRGAGRGHLAEKDLIGKARIVSNWNEAQVIVCIYMYFHEVCFISAMIKTTQPDHLGSSSQKTHLNLIFTREIGQIKCCEEML